MSRHRTTPRDTLFLGAAEPEGHDDGGCAGLDAEVALAGKRLDEQTLSAATDAAFMGAKSYEHNAFKIPLGKRTLARALRETSLMEI